MQPLVSVVMSVYNGEKYLNESIESILNQSYKNIEFIIINIGINLVNSAYYMYVNNNAYEILSLIFEIILGIIMIIGGLQLIRDKINKEKFKNRTSM